MNFEHPTTTLIPPLQLTAKGILRISVGRYRLDLRRRILKILSDIYYRMNFYNIIMSGSILIISKIIIQVDAKSDA